MEKEIEDNPKFAYKQKALIVKGFYKNIVVETKDYRKTKNGYIYKCVTNEGNNIEVKENQLKELNMIRKLIYNNKEF